MKKPICLRIKKDLLMQLAEIAKETDMTKTFHVEVALREYISKQKKTSIGFTSPESQTATPATPDNTLKGSIFDTGK